MKNCLVKVKACVHKNSGGGWLGLGMEKRLDLVWIWYILSLFYSSFQLFYNF